MRARGFSAFLTTFALLFLVLALLGSAIPDPSRAAAPVLSGRVYSGQVGDESAPLAGVSMELYASNNAGSQGVLVAQAVTDRSGWYGLETEVGFEFYTIVEIDLRGYVSVGARSVSGTVLDANRIRYAVPLDGQTLTGNRFWDLPAGQATATATRQPTSTSTGTSPPTRTTTQTTHPTSTPTATTTGTRAPTETAPMPTVTRATNTPSPSPTATATLPPECVDLLVNGDFEQGSLNGWFDAGDVSIGTGRGSDYGAQLGGVDDAFGELGQGVELPAGAYPVRWEFWWLAEDETEQPGDVLDALVQYGDGQVDHLSTLRALAPLNTWHLEVIDLSPYAGQAVAITFQVRTDVELPTAFRIDDVRVLACAEPTPSATRTLEPGTPTATRPAPVNTLTPTASATRPPGGDTATPTRPASASPTPTGEPMWREDRPSLELSFSGSVLLVGGAEDGLPGSGILVGLYGSANAEELGERFSETYTELDGSFFLACLHEAELDLPYYFLVLEDPNHVVVDAQPGEGGEVAGELWIRYLSPSAGDHPGNLFLVELRSGEPQPVDPPPIVPGWVYALPPPAPVPTPVDIYIRGVEVVQVVQCFDKSQGYTNCTDNSLELTAGKLTAVRVYIGCTGCAGSSVTVPVRAMRAYCTKGSATMPGGCAAWGGPSTLQMFKAPLGKTLQQLRDSNDGAATWILPTWVGETLFSVDVTVNMDTGQIPETNKANNHKWLQVPLYVRQPLNIKWALVDMGSGLADPKHVGAASSWMARIYPMPVQYSQSANIKYTGKLGNLLDYLNIVYNGMKPKPDVLLGWLPASSGCAGLAWVGGNTCYSGQCWNVSTSADLASHEVGHNLGMSHPDEDEECWPFPGDSVIRETGYDCVSKFVWPGAGSGTPGTTGAHDIMDSNLGAWVAPYTWNRWLNKPYSSQWALVKQWCATAGSSPAQVELASDTYLRFSRSPQPAMLVSGRVNPDGSGELDPLFEFPAEEPFPESLPGGSLCVDFRSAGGAMLYSHCFELARATASSGTTGTPGSFAFLLALPPDAARVVLRRGAEVLAERYASAHSPWLGAVQVQLGAPGEGMARVTCEASDEDGDPLQFLAQYSHDGGASWLPLAVRYEDSVLEVDTARWPGSEAARVRVLASDGFHTAEAQSEPFEMPRHGPQVYITHPSDGALLHPDEAVILTGFADDAEEGVLSGERLTWISDRRAVLGYGEQLALPPGWLGPGQHLLTLLAEDGNGMTGEDSVRIMIGWRLYLPLLRK